MLTMRDDADTVLRAIDAGAHGYTLKDTPPEKVIQALATVAEGGVVLGPTVGMAVLASVKRTSAALPPPFDRLTERERQILTGLAAGESNARIARQIGLTEKTVRNQVSMLFTKLGVPDRVRAALMVRDSGVLPYLSPPTRQA
jgi:two-component system nitrate/nitrite response regulator NarL